MAEARPFELDLDEPEQHTRPAYRRLGLLNGLLIGLALGLGAWAPEIVRVARLPLPLAVPTLLFGVLLMVLVGGLVGWLSARIHNTVVTVLLWLAAGVAALLIIGYAPFFGRSAVIWLADPRFFGRHVFPNTLGGTTTGLILGGVLIFLVLGVLGLLQSHRLEGLVHEVGRRRLPNRRVWAALLLPLPIVFLTSLATSSVMSNPAATAAEITHSAILRAQTIEGDLRDVPNVGNTGLLSLRPVQDRLAGPFSLGIAGVDMTTSTVVITANFDSGAWINCRVINDQLTFCYDAAPAYTTGLISLVTGQPLPEDCRGCILQATDEAAAWLAERRAEFGPQPAAERLAQWGNTVLMRVVGESITAECWIEGVSPAVLTGCVEE
ncbi:MAG: hypothetical protein KBG73_10625 [Candidatus Promineofilum sp.]|nr:hypothetical protein [Promineifilum sp.]